jgi:hypothetical protein
MPGPPEHGAVQFVRELKEPFKWWVVAEERKATSAHRMTENVAAHNRPPSINTGGDYITGEGTGRTELEAGGSINTGQGAGDNRDNPATEAPVVVTGE